MTAPATTSTASTVHGTSLRIRLSPRVEIAWAVRAPRTGGGYPAFTQANGKSPASTSADFSLLRQPVRRRSRRLLATGAGVLVAVLLEALLGRGAAALAPAGGAGRRAAAGAARRLSPARARRARGRWRGARRRRGGRSRLRLCRLRRGGLRLRRRGGRGHRDRAAVGAARAQADDQRDRRGGEGELGRHARHRSNALGAPLPP